MGHKINPILFRLGNSKPILSSWYSDANLYSHLIYQDIELRSFLSNILRNKGILLRSCSILRCQRKLSISMDLFFSYILTKQAKFFWARSLFRMVKSKYIRISRIKDLRNFVRCLDDDEKIMRRRSYVLKARKKLFILCKKKNCKKVRSRVFYKNRFFFFVVHKTKADVVKKEGVKFLSVRKNLRKSQYRNYSLIRLSCNKFNRLFVLQKFRYNFRGYFLKGMVEDSFMRGDILNLIELNQNLCKSIQAFSGVEDVQLSLVSSQLSCLPSFKFFYRQVFKDLVRFQQSRELRKYFVETLEAFYFAVRTFGFGNAYILSCVLVFLLENVRKQVLVAKFIKKILQLLFFILPLGDLSISGIKILIKGRFNKRRRTKKVVLQEGQISLQTIDIPVDYYQTQAVTIYGSFGIKVWISKC